MNTSADSLTPAKGTTPGTLYGIGVGPGSPDLLTLRAVHALQKVDIILAAASPRNEHSLALSIAGPHLPPGTDTARLDFPMTRDKSVLDTAWKANAETVAALLRQGKNAAFLTLGDPLIYSTFGYLMRTLAALHPDLAVEVIPGITSYQEAAAKTRTILCEADENLLVIPGINEESRIASALAAADSTVILKAYKNAGAIYKALGNAGKNGETLFVSRIGLEGEQTIHGLDNAPEKPHYLSLILVPPVRG